MNFDIVPEQNKQKKNQRIIRNEYPDYSNKPKLCILTANQLLNI